MHLPGRLAATTLGDLLGNLYRARATGTLELVEGATAAGSRVHRIVMESGLVRDVETALGVERLGELLRSEGFIAAHVAGWLSRRIAQAPDRRAGELLVDEAHVDADLVRAALRYQLRKRLDKLFTIRDAGLRFRVALRREVGSDDIPLSPHEFLHGRPRSRDRAAREPAHQSPPRQTSPRQPPPARRADPTRARHLAVLGLGPGAAPADVQRAFRKLAAEAHPDRHPGASPRERAALVQRFAALSAAYHRLIA